VNLILSVGQSKNIKRNVIMKTKHYIMSSILLFALMSCALPGVSQPVTLPTFDPNAIPTMVALTANAAMAQTATATPLAPPDLSKTPLEKLPDGSTKYTDTEIGFEITFPAGVADPAPQFG
jgi:hypothetical protein